MSCYNRYIAELWPPAFLLRPTSPLVKGVHREKDCSITLHATAVRKRGGLCLLCHPGRTCQALQWQSGPVVFRLREATQDP
jgi:hypothetical protein